MKDAIIGIFIGVVVVLIAYPYFSIAWIHNSIDSLTEEVRKLRKGDKDD